MAEPVNVNADTSNWTCKELKRLTKVLKETQRQTSNWTCKELKQMLNGKETNAKIF